MKIEKIVAIACVSSLFSATACLFPMVFFGTLSGLFYSGSQTLPPSSCSKEDCGCNCIVCNNFCVRESKESIEFCLAQGLNYTAALCEQTEEQKNEEIVGYVGFGILGFLFVLCICLAVGIGVCLLREEKVEVVDSEL